MRYIPIVILFISTFCYGQLEISPVFKNNNLDLSKNRLARTAASEDTLSLPIEENFASLTYSNIWSINHGTYLNNHFAKNQPSIGVLTLDGIDGTGEPYLFSTQKSSAAGIGDYITSKAIDISNVTPTDGLAFSFFWQQGTPHDPNRDPLWESGERLKVYFKDSTEVFRQVWPDGETVNRIIATGLTADTFYLENIVVEEKYLHDGFQFKLEYYGTLVGNYGIFNVDNIYMNTGIATLGADTTFKEPLDYAISLAPRTFLNQYSSVPVDHFLAADETIIDDSIFTKIYSLDELFIQDTDSSIYITDDSNGSFIYSSGSDDFEFESLVKGVPLGINWAIDQAALKAGIDATLTTETKTFRTLLSIITPDSKLDTDSASSLTTLADYYAYDDGTMEAGLGVRTVGEFVQAFDFIKNDTLKGFYIYFPKYGLDLENTFITYNIYKSLENIDGAIETELLYYQNGVVEYSTDSISLNSYIYIPLSREQLVPAGRYYFGIEQDNTNRVLVGLDYSLDRSEDIYYRVFDNPWETFKSNDGVGCIAIRPVIGSENFIEPEEEEEETPPLARVANPQYIYPNPGNGTFRFDEEVNEITIFNTNGREINTLTVSEKEIDLSFLESGLYLIHMKTLDDITSTRLLISED